MFAAESRIDGTVPDFNSDPTLYSISFRIMLMEKCPEKKNSKNKLKPLMAGSVASRCRFVCKLTGYN